mgnify:CR=1 FL=1
MKCRTEKRSTEKIKLTYKEEEQKKVLEFRNRKAGRSEKMIPMKCKQLS